MYEEKDKRVLAFQAKLNELKEKVPALKHSEFYRDRGQCKVLCGYFDCLTAPFAVDYTAENPDVLISRVKRSLKKVVRVVEESIEILERLEQ